MNCTQWLKENSMNVVGQTNDFFAEKCSIEFEKKFGCKVEFQSYSRDMAYANVEGLRICAYYSHSCLNSESINKICFMDTPNELNDMYDLGQAFIKLENKKNGN